MEQAHIALIPSPGMGHLISLVEFSKQLIQKHPFNVTIILPNDGPLSEAQEIFFHSLSSTSINHIILPPVNLDDLPDDVKIETRIVLTVARSLPSLREVIKDLNLVALVVDLFGTDAFDVAKEFGIPPYLFYPSSAMSLCFCLYLPVLDEMVSSEYRDFPELIRIPGCLPIHGKELPDPVQDRENDAYKWMLHNVKRFTMAEGFIVNSFIDLEPGPIKALQEKQISNKYVYPVGPIIHSNYNSTIDGKQTERHECLKWLDGQPHGSVLFVSFGSGGTMSREQLLELALGLEMSEQRFLWVVRPPNETNASATYFNIQYHNDPLAYMPEGFIERIKGRGLLVPFWAPQAEILAHESTGGFLTHCGWNSILESVVNGVPLIAWPLYAEQKMNAFMLAEDSKAALRVKVNEYGVVTRDDIMDVAKELMEGKVGKGPRTSMKMLNEAASMVYSDDGSSTKSLAELASKWNEKTCT